MTLEHPQLDRIVSDPEILDGQPCIKGHRITVRRVLSILATYDDREEIRRDYPGLEDEDIRQTLLYAAEHLDDERLLALRDAS